MEGGLTAGSWWIDLNKESPALRELGAVGHNDIQIACGDVPSAQA